MPRFNRASVGWYQVDHVIKAIVSLHVQGNQYLFDVFSYPHLIRYCGYKSVTLFLF